MERRGYRWDDAEVEDKENVRGDAGAGGGEGLGHGDASANGVPERGVVDGGGRGGSLTDGELRRRLREQMERDEEEDGLHI